ncbi:MAG: tetrathionate reductase family octaheme c-type cytochrome [Desulfobacteraceae bacterium]|jgi:octaheme c-type cytochrome (tetrathionate reductase family)|nr:tetrathionate reductase family octaheme c-type cytochrome [Desulfobacteraceae bacterium]
MKSMRNAKTLISAGTLWLVLSLVAGTPLAAWASSSEDEPAPGRAMARQVTKVERPGITTDHSRLEPLQRTFTKGAEITQACMSCHTEAESQFHQSIHWSWRAGEEKGKAGYSLNNFCISANKGMDKGCMKCHPGWGKSTEAINCLVCHGQKKIQWDEIFQDYAAFAESDDPDEKEIAAEIQTEIQAAAQAVAQPGRQNCGSCHFYGGGGDGVKHGDLDSSLAKPNKALDVHMGVDGQNFDCTRCHTTHEHHIAGRIYTAPAYTDRKSLVEDDLIAKITCESCHTSTPHKEGSKPNDHTDKVACQSCHIPTMARVNPTKMSWDWSKAGKLKDGKPYTTEDEFGKHDYMSIKGQMRWDKNIQPEYFWYNGVIESVTVKDAVDPSGTVAVSHPVGDRTDPDSRIYPFKVHRGKQPYDKVHKTLLAPLLSTPKGYWTTFDMKGALQNGQKALGLPFSGEFDFVPTTYVFPTTHMVAPKDNVVQCSECHVKKEGRLQSLSGFYMPGRDHNSWLNTIGWVAVLGALVGVMLHGLGRIFTSGNGRKEN